MATWSLWRVGVSAVVLVGLAGAAAGQAAGPDPVLRGPKVKDNSAYGERTPFAGRPRGKDAQRPVPQPVFMKAVMTLNAEGAAQETRLSDEQAAKLKAIEQEFRDQQREFAAAHRGEARELAAKLPPEDRARLREMLAPALGAEGRGPANPARKGAGKKPPKNGPAGEEPSAPAGMDDPMAPEMGDGPMRDRPSESEVQEARAQLRALFEQAPKPDEARARMWAVLSDPQRKAVEAELVKVREGMAAKASEQGKRKKAAGADSSKVDLDDPRIPERARERLKNMTPEQREEAIKRLKERRQGEPGKRPAGRKPPPPIEDVNIPSPEDGPK